MSFDQALQFVLKEEGGYSNNPRDRGGPTNYGITQSTYNAYRYRSVQKITPEEVKDIYLKGYWEDACCDKLDELGYPKLAEAVMDTAVNCGSGSARLMLQRALFVRTDGVIGPVTLGAVKLHNEQQLVEAFLEQRERRYRDIVNLHPDQVEFLPIWLGRIKRLKRYLGYA